MISESGSAARRMPGSAHSRETSSSVTAQAKISMARRSCAPGVLDRSRRGLGRVFAGAQRIDLNPRLAQPVAQHADLVFELDLAQARDPLVGQAGRCAVAARPLRWLAGVDR